MRIRDSLLSDFNREAGQTRGVLEAVPEDRLDWKPHDKSMSLGVLAGHVAESPGWTQGMMEADLDFAAASDWTPFVPQNRTELLEFFEKTTSGFRSLIADLENEFLLQEWCMRDGDKVHMRMPRHEAMRTIAIHHTLHHRGQLTVYLRLLEVPVPPTYGPTADFPDKF